MNPSGKLPLTFPNKEDEQDFSPQQWPGLPDPSNPVYANYTERLEVGYRYYDAHGLQFDTGFPFGHGLSYSAFGYTDIAASKDGVSFTLTNTGKVAGAEVAQLYLSFPAAAGEPPKNLKGFKKVRLSLSATRPSLEDPLATTDCQLSTTYRQPPAAQRHPLTQPSSRCCLCDVLRRARCGVARGALQVQLDAGASQKVEIGLAPVDRSVWAVGKGWEAVEGDFTVSVGSSSRDIRLTAPFTA